MRDVCVHRAQWDFTQGGIRMGWGSGGAFDMFVYLSRGGAPV
jgi:hypothetical protein